MNSYIGILLEIIRPKLGMPVKRVTVCPQINMNSRRKLSWKFKLKYPDIELKKITFWIYIRQI